MTITDFSDGLPLLIVYFDSQCYCVVANDIKCLKKNIHISNIRINNSNKSGALLKFHIDFVELPNYNK